MFSMVTRANNNVLQHLKFDNRVVLFLIFFFNIYSFLRDGEKQSMSGGGSEREGDTELEAGSRLCAVSIASGLEAVDHEITT